MSINPQKENGYTPIANEILEALSRFRIPGESWQVLSVILRKTYGWNKKYATISNAEFANMTGISRQNVHRSLKKLIDNKIIKCDNSGFIYRYSFNKHYNGWGMAEETEATALNIEGKNRTQKRVQDEKQLHSILTTTALKSEGKLALKSESLKRKKDNNKTIDRSRKKSRPVLKISFARKILKYKNKFPPELLKDFYSWWTDTDGKVYRFETDKMFDVEKMLLRYEPSWRKRNFKPKEKIKKDRPVEAIIADMQPSFDYLATMHDAVQTVQPNERPRVMEYLIKRGLTNDDFTKEPKDCIKKMENHKTN